jgi:hypothetical protein
MNATEYRNLADKHLQIHRPKMYRQMQESGELVEYLNRLGAGAEELEQETERQYLEKNPPPEDYMERLNHLAQARQFAREVVMTELILVPGERDDAVTVRGDKR